MLADARCLVALGTGGGLKGLSVGELAAVPTVEADLADLTRAG